MAENADTNVQQLFKKWRGGDAEAGQQMAQRFSDWYYAIAACRLGDRKGRAPLDRACQSFAQGIVGITRSGDLIEWAYGLVQQEVQNAGGRFNGGDAGNALTGNRTPSRLLREVRKGLDADQQQLLHLVYTGATNTDQINRLAEAQGGLPVALVRARYTLKRLLKTNANVGFQETPLELDFDRCPLPLYEAGGLASDDEEMAFEKWMLNDPNVCRDVAEFAAFTHALRAGLLLSEDAASDAPAPAPAPASQTTTTPRPEPMVVRPDQRQLEPITPTKSAGMSPVMMGVAAVVVLVVLAIAFLALRG